MKASIKTPTEVLREVAELLELYSPTWYTNEQRDRVLIAIGEKPSLDIHRRKD